MIIMMIMIIKIEREKIFIKKTNEIIVVKFTGETHGSCSIITKRNKKKNLFTVVFFFFFFFFLEFHFFIYTTPKMGREGGGEVFGKIQTGTFVTILQ